MLPGAWRLIRGRFTGDRFRERRTAWFRRLLAHRLRGLGRLFDAAHVFASVFRLYWGRRLYLTRHGVKDESQMFFNFIKPRGGIACHQFEVAQAIVQLLRFVG
jgi:hypothetical protein